MPRAAGTLGLGEKRVSERVDAAHVNANAIDSEMRLRLASVSSISPGDVLRELATGSGALADHHKVSSVTMGAAIGNGLAEEADWEVNRSEGAIHLVG
jgi:hypothetical protein